MGSKMGRNYASLGRLSRGTYRAPIYRLWLQLHKRYIDDVVGVACCRRVELDAYINFVSNFHPAVQFTRTIFTTELPFLDINLRITNDQISTSIYYKGIDTHTYLHNHSSHPRHYKESLPRSQLLRLRRLCSDESDYLERGKEMISFFVQRGYRDSSAERDLDQIRQIDRLTAINRLNSTDSEQNTIP